LTRVEPKANHREPGHDNDAHREASTTLQTFYQSQPQAEQPQGKYKYKISKASMWPMGLRDRVDDQQRDIEMEKEGVYNDGHRSQSRKYRTNNKSLMKK